MTHSLIPPARLIGGSVRCSSTCYSAGPRGTKVANPRSGGNDCHRSDRLRGGSGLPGEPPNHARANKKAKKAAAKTV